MSRDDLDAETLEIAHAITTMNKVMKMARDLGVPEEQISKIGYILRNGSPHFKGFWKVKSNTQKGRKQ
jgi:hypothetical protein